MKVVVPEHEAGERLDAWLAQQDAAISRTQFQKMVKDGEVTVNGKTTKSGYVVRHGDVIETAANTSLVKTTQVREISQSSGVRVIDETPDFLVIEKPSGLLVHPAPEQRTGTLVDFLLAHDPKIAEVGDLPAGRQVRERPGIVHRLDREASGLMVVARTQKAYENLKSQFQAHSIFKEYLALVWGKVVKDHDVIETPIGRVAGKGRMAARTQSVEGDKEARTLYDVIERFPHASLVKVTTETGRMHQVRVHMKSISHPLVGDSLYAPGRKSPSLDKCPRLFLHAAALGFNDPSTGERREYRSELPEDLKTFLDVLKAKHAKKK